MTENARSAGWIGRWFTPTIGRRYYVPPDAANHADYRGMHGECIDRAQSAFGHSWATIKFEDGTVGEIRTNYLLPEDGELDKAVELGIPSFTPEERIAYAWEGPSNSGTEKLRGHG
jgi:hypothetical protein